MKLPIFQIDAFADQQFQGNPAAVVILAKWLPDETMQAIAQENNLAETAFVVQTEKSNELRWFTPEVEIDLCGHATLASAYVLFNHGYVNGQTVSFTYQGGKLNVSREGDLLTLDFPSRPPEPIDSIPGLEKTLGNKPDQVLAARDLLVIFEKQSDIVSLQPDFMAIKEWDYHAVIVSAPGEDCDFVSRFFAPRAGIPEDPVTGSSHCTLIPYWSNRLDKKELHARQLSKRGGELFCKHLGERVSIAGRAVEYLKGEIEI